MTHIQIPSPLRQYTGKQAAVSIAAKTVGDALAGLVAQHPDLKRHLYSDDGKLRAFVNVYVNEEDMRYLQKEATVLSDGDTISIVPSIAGGSGKMIVGPEGPESASQRPAHDAPKNRRMSRLARRCCL
jgi:molybdopterin converting factor small subunit